MLMVDEDKRENQCFVKATRKGEPTFTLRAQDKSAADVIIYWLSKNPQLSVERQQEVFDTIRRFHNWDNTKAAD